MSAAEAPGLPPRYQAVARLGKGGGGEVWRVSDRVKKRQYAVKLLAEDSGEHEVMALVREATTLSGLEGLGVPRVVAFGALADGRKFMVRELVEGQSYEERIETKRDLSAGRDAKNANANNDGRDGFDFLQPLASAADTLTALHRAGLLHGDVKPANIVVEESGRATLVDLGLAAPWREGGTRPEGLTPRYAAPELFAGDPLTVRAEVYALGATLRDALELRGGELTTGMLTALEKVSARATENKPEARFPSVDEFSAALRSAGNLGVSRDDRKTGWPVIGIDSASHDLRELVHSRPAGAAIALEGDAKSGRSTLLRRLAWTVGVGGDVVVLVDTPSDEEGTRVLVSEIARASKRGGLLVVDDLTALPPVIVNEIGAAARAGAKVVAAAKKTDLAKVVDSEVTAHAIPKLDDSAARDLVRRAIPSLTDSLTTAIIERAAGNPGVLRGILTALGSRVIVSVSELDEILSEENTPLSEASREHTMRALDRALETGRIDEAATLLTSLEADVQPDDAVELAVAAAKIALARGDLSSAQRALDAVRGSAARDARARSFHAIDARVKNRAGDFAGAASLASQVIDAGGDDVLASDAASVRGVALAYMGKDDEARASLERAVTISEKIQDKRAIAIALGSLAIAHQRAGRKDEARKAYESALAAAENAKDAWTVATTRLNLAGLAQGEGDLGAALVHLEAAVDMGRRAGGRVAVQQALFNLANLDLYLGRYARAESSIKSLSEERGALDKNARAQLLGLEAELLGRTGDIEKSARLYTLCAEMYEATGRPLDAAEVRLEGILTRARVEGADARALLREYEELERALADTGFREHEAFALLVRGTLALLEGDETRARTALDKSLAEAERAGRREWQWRALESRARLATMQGAYSLARRDTESALSILEETARLLPRDLREVFWNDPRRRALRQSLAQTVNSPASGISSSAMPGSTTVSGVSGVSGALFGRTPTIALGVSSEDRLARILEITRELAREHDMARLLEKVTDHAVALASAERGFVLLANDRGVLEMVAASTARGDEEHARFSRSVAEEVVRTGEAVVVTSAKDDERVAKAVSIQHLMIQSIACVPIRGAPPVGRPIGALYLETRLREAARFKDELPILSAFADQAAIAIENARLIEENQARANDLARANSDLQQANAHVEGVLGRRTEQLATARRDLKETRAALRSHFGYAGLVGTSAPMRKLYSLIDRIKDTDVPVIISGESGTGKEVVAKAIHTSSARGKNTFVGVNCGAIPENLLESELFGHIKGAFTGADRDRKGLFKEAEGGSLLLDEIGELPLKMQAGLLRVLQERKVRPVGATVETSVDTRIIAATNRDLAAMVEQGSFREDLLYRLQVVEIAVPPLRDRPEDILPLADHFLSLFSARYRREKKSVARDARKRLLSYEWPGNVRQLEHVLLNAWLMSESDEIAMEDFSIPSGESRPTSSRVSVRPEARNEGEYREAEKDRILAALTKTNWNRVKAAEIIGMPRRTFYRRLKEYGIL